MSLILRYIDKHTRACCINESNY